MSTGFWAIPDLGTVKSPVSIMKEQGTALTEATKGLLVVNVTPRYYTENLYVKMEIVVPALSNYKYEFMVYRQTVLSSYPGSLSSNVLAESFDIKSEAEFIDVLKGVLSSEKTKSLLEGLMSQALSLSK